MKLAKRYRKKPIVIDAMRFDGSDSNYEDIEEWSEGKVYIRGIRLPPEEREMEMQTLEGTMRALVGDYIIKGVKGEFYPCKPNIFKMTYDEVKS